MEVLRNKRILVIQTAFIGDAILTLPMIQELYKRDPGCEIDVLCIPGTREIFNASPCVTNTIVYDKRKEDKSLLKIFTFAKLIKVNDYSAIYSPHRSLRTALMILLSGAKNTFGFSNSTLKEVYSRIIFYNKKDHEVKRNLSLIEYNNEQWRLLPEINPPDSVKSKVDQFFNENPGGKFAALAPGSVWETKKYPVEYFIKIARFIASRGYKLILLGSKTDLDICDKIKLAIPEQAIITAGRFSIIESIEILKHCSLLICNDSAPTHMGMCADIPVITIYCSTVPEFGFYPYNGKSTIISFDGLSCKPCGIHGHNKCPIGTFECAHKISMNDIYKKIEKIII